MEYRLTGLILVIKEDDLMKSDDNTNIYPSGNKYMINKTIHGKSKYYGTFTTLDEARRYRDFLVDHNWNVCCKKKRNSSHIFKNRNKYMIMKRVNSKNEYFGRFDTLEEAKIYRDFLEEHDWDVKYKKSAKPSNIYYNKNQNIYVLRKTVNHERVHFGTYSSLEEAVHERDFYQSIDWDLDLLDLY